MAHTVVRRIVRLKNLPRAVAIVLIIAASLFVYWPALRNGFVWDDTALVLRDPIIRSWQLIPESFRHFLFLDATASNFYRPLQRLTFTADYALYGFTRPWGWHLTSMLVHAGAAVALFHLARQLSSWRRDEMGAFLQAEGCAPAPPHSPDQALPPLAINLLPAAVALLWAVHPLHTSAVTYISGRADPLAALFGFIALGWAWRGLEHRAWLAPLGPAAAFFAAMLSKESGIMALVIWFWFLIWRGESRRVLLRWLLIAGVLLASYSALRFTAHKTPPPVSPASSLLARPALAARAFAEYAGLLIVPVQLRMERDIRGAAPLQTLGGATLFTAFVAWCLLSRRRVPAVALCLGAFAIAYLPISNLLPLNATLAEHWLYLPSAFLFLAAVLSIWEMRTPRVVVALVACWLLFLATRTLLRQADWRNPRTFLHSNLAHGGESARMHINLGNLELTEGRREVALGHYRRALELAPSLPFAWFGVANVALQKRDFPTAHEALQKAETSPVLVAECLQMRAALEHLESGRDTGDLLRQAADLAPRNWPLRQRYIQHLGERGALVEAARESRQFLAQQPFRAESWHQLGALLERLAQPRLAARAYEEAAARDVRDAEAARKAKALGEAITP